MPTSTTPLADRHRGAVYWAEDQVARVMATPSRRVRIAGQILELPPQITLGTIEHAQRFVDQVLAHPDVVSAYPRRGPVTLVPTRGFRKASYRNRAAEGEIRIPQPDSRGRWALAQTVLLHEVAHHLAVGAGHGREFRAALRELYRLHLGSGAEQLLGHLFAPLDQLPPTRSSSEEPIVRRVGALLAKAESTTSEQEAHACLSKATLLAHRHSIDLAVAAARRDHGERPTHRMVDIGPPRQSTNKVLVSLMCAIARAWEVPIDIGPGSVYVLAYGVPGDLDHVEAMFTTASTVMFTQAAEHVRAGSWRGTSYLAADSQGGPERRPVSSRIAHSAFCAGFVHRLGQLMAESLRTSQPDLAGDDATQRQVALALRNKELAVREYHHSASKARGAWRGTTSTASTAALSRAAGARAAENMQRGRLRVGRPALPGFPGASG